MTPERKAEIMALTFERKRAFWETAIPKEDRRQRPLAAINMDIAEAVPELLDEIEALEAALRNAHPPTHGEYGGPLVRTVAHYEDGTEVEVKFLGGPRAVREGKS